MALAHDHDHEYNSTDITVDLTGNVYIDSILWGGNRTESNTITYSFWKDDSIDDEFDDIDSESTDWSDEERAALQLGLETWANVANINFAEMSDNDDEAVLQFTLVNNDELGDGVLGRFNPPGTTGEGIGHFNEKARGWGNLGLQQGGFGFITVIHEIGHGLGLAHPHDDGGNSSRFPGVRTSDDLGRNALNQGIFTTMSYNDGLVSDNNNARGYGYQGTPMAYDIAAIQHLYGANMNHRTGNDTYLLPSRNKSGTFYAAIWDAGGTDTIKARSSSRNAVINLNEASLVGPNGGGFLSSMEGILGGFTIANGVDIENAVGSSGDDSIIGNDGDNLLKGGRGDDDITGKKGIDKLRGMAGADSLNGNRGNDMLIGGSGNDDLMGRANNDVLKGGTGNDVLNGGAGTDELSGNGGQDLFVLTRGKGLSQIQDFQLRSDSLGLAQGISFNDLIISQNKNQAVIGLGGDRLAILAGVNADQITSDLFVSV